LNISKYTVDISFRVDQRELRKLDATLKNLERKLQTFGKRLDKSLKLNISSFTVDQNRLNRVLGNALDLASRRTVFQISNFAIDQSHLNRSLTSAMQQAVRVASRSATLRPNTHVNATSGGGGIRGSHLAAGGIGGLVARAYLPALALAGGGYGLAALNNRNQQIVSAQLQTNAVVGQATGNPQQGQQAFDWLRYQANRVGFNYLDAAPDYNRLLSGLTGAGMSVAQGQDVFKGFSEYARVNKLDRTQQQRVFRALSQVAGKNKLQSEELVGQLAESMPGAVSIFAEAYQAKLKAEGKGGGKTGQEAITELLDAMKKGQVKGDILTYAGTVASKRAEPGLTAAGKASQAEQARFQNAYTDLARIASDSGVESGFARLFRTLNAGLSESGPMVEKLARGFDDVTKYVSYALLSFQSLQRFFEGKDSYLGDKLFPTEEAKTKAFEFLETFKSTISELGTLTGNLYNKWVQLLGLMDSSETLKALTTSLRVVGNGANAINSLIEGDMSGAKSAAQSALAGYGNTITAPGRKGANLIIGGINSGLDAVGPYGPRIPTIGQPFSSGDSDWDWMNREKTRQAQLFANRRKDNFNGTVGIFPMDQSDARSRSLNPYVPSGGRSGGSLDIKAEVKVNIEAATVDDFNDKFQKQFKAELENTLQQYTR
jgi:tape measure domain-containing protein